MASTPTMAMRFALNFIVEALTALACFTGSEFLIVWKVNVLPAKLSNFVIGFGKADTSFVQADEFTSVPAVST